MAWQREEAEIEQNKRRVAIAVYGSWRHVA